MMVRFGVAKRRKRGRRKNPDEPLARTPIYYSDPETGKLYDTIQYEPVHDIMPFYATHLRATGREWTMYPRIPERFMPTDWEGYRGWLAAKAAPGVEAPSEQASGRAGRPATKPPLPNDGYWIGARDPTEPAGITDGMEVCWISESEWVTDRENMPGQECGRVNSVEAHAGGSVTAVFVEARDIGHGVIHSAAGWVYMAHPDDPNPTLDAGTPVKVRFRWPKKNPAKARKPNAKKRKKPNARRVISRYLRGL